MAKNNNRSSKKRINIENLQLGYSDGRDVSEEEKLKFIKELDQMSSDFGNVTTEDFLNIFLKENGLIDGKLLLDQDSMKETNSSGGHAKGLIQFVPSTAKSLGLDQKELSKMSPSQQLDYVRAYYESLGNTAKINSYDDLYLATFYPAALGKDDNFVIAKDSEKAYTANANIDEKYGNNDGVLTKGDFLKYSQAVLPSSSDDLFIEVDNDEAYAEAQKSVNTRLREIGDAGKAARMNIPVTGETSYVTSEDGGTGYNVTDVTMPNGERVKIKTMNNQRFEYVGSNLYAVTPGKNNSEEDRFTLINKESKPNGSYFPKESGGYLKEDRSLASKKDNVYKYESKLIVDNYKDNPSPQLSKQAKQFLISAKQAELSESALSRASIDVYENVVFPEMQDKVENAVRQREMNVSKLNRQLNLEENDDLKKELQTKYNQELNELNTLKKKSSLFNREVENIKRDEAVYFSTNQQKRLDDINKKIKNKQFNSDEEKEKLFEEKKVLQRAYNRAGGRKGVLYNDPSQEFWLPFGAKEKQYKDLVKLAERELEDYEDLGGAEIQDMLDVKPYFTKEEISKQEAKKKKGFKTPVVSLGNNVLDQIDKSNIARKAITEEASKNEDFAKTLDKDYWQKQKQLNLETIKKLEAGSQMPDFTVKDDGQPNYQYIFGQAGDIARGLIGMAGATTDVPEREMSAMMRESLDDARIQKDMGLSAAERDFMKQNAERAFGFAQQASKVGGAAAYLGAGGRNAAMLQDQYARMGVTDAQLRRQSQARFDAAARDEQAFEERAFQDRYTQAMMAKEQGAALARDAYTNASERAQFESQYGKGSQYQQLMNEVIASKKQDIYLKQKGEEERINRAVEDRKKRNIEIDKNYLS